LTEASIVGPCPLQGASGDDSGDAADGMVDDAVVLLRKLLLRELLWARGDGASTGPAAWQLLCAGQDGTSTGPAVWMLMCMEVPGTSTGSEAWQLLRAE